MMITLRTIVGACNKYVKALKKKLTGKRDVRRRRKIYYAATGTTPVDELLYYDNEAVDNVINEFIDNRQKTTVCSSHQTREKPSRHAQ